MFIRLAEEEGLIGELGERVLLRACAALRRLRLAGYSDLVCSINVSPLQFSDQCLASRFENALQAHDLRPDALAVEITESAFAQHSAATEESLRLLRALGVRLWLDDFGVGHASLARLQDHPFDCLKIDRSFLLGELDARRWRLLGGIVHLGVELDMEVLAEGVETLAIRDRVAQLGCRRLQGYFFSRALNEESLNKWLAQHHSGWLRGAAISASANR